MECEITDLLLYMELVRILVKAKGSLIFYANVCVLLIQKIFECFSSLAGGGGPVISIR